MKNETAINKTIIVPYNDLSDMMIYCLDAEKNISRNFLDWYLKEDAFFCKSGILIVEDERAKHKNNERYTLSFDFSHPSCPSFSLFDYARKRKVLGFTFNREDNLSLMNTKTKILFMDYKYIKETDYSIVNTDKEERTTAKEAKATCRIARPGKYAGHQELVAALNHNKRQEPIIVNQKAKFLSELSILYIYSLMYYCVKNKPEEVFLSSTSSASPANNTQEIKSTYKYTGYIDINKGKVYKCSVPKDQSAPSRDYQRHIQKWSVRGHYRRRKDGTLKWIEPFYKGEGELEKRVYGTKEEDKVNIRPQVFDVVRNVKTEKEEHIRVSIHLDDILPKIKKEVIPKTERKKKFMLIETIIDFLKKLFFTKQINA